jgi:hypothetical protein
MDLFPYSETASDLTSTTAVAVLVEEAPSHLVTFCSCLTEILGVRVVAYGPGTATAGQPLCQTVAPAELSMQQQGVLRRAEEEIGVVLVAYKDA